MYRSLHLYVALLLAPAVLASQFLPRKEQSHYWRNHPFSPRAMWPWFKSFSNWTCLDFLLYCTSVCSCGFLLKGNPKCLHFLLVLVWELKLYSRFLAHSCFRLQLDLPSYTQDHIVFTLDCTTNWLVHLVQAWMLTPVLQGHQKSSYLCLLRHLNQELILFDNLHFWRSM